MAEVNTRLRTAVIIEVKQTLTTGMAITGIPRQTTIMGNTSHREVKMK
jgi:hypothetical protein